MNAEGILKKHCQRNTVSLFKGFLVMLEDLQKEHQIQFNKLRKNLPKDTLPILEQADYFDEEKLQHLRKLEFLKQVDLMRTSFGLIS